MSNLIFNNEIKVEVNQSPQNPIEGDDVTFVATASLINTTSEYSIPSSYFFSYTWLVSNDGGQTFYQTGQDLDTLVIPSIRSSFFSSTYKVQVALIDLDNILLTEDGQSLTTQAGEILISNNNNSQLNIQTANDAVISTIPQNTINNDLVALDLVNMQSVIDDASTFDTTINDETTALVYSGQVTINRSYNNNTQQEVTIADLPDPIVENVTNSQQSITISSAQCLNERQKDLNGGPCAILKWCRDNDPCKKGCINPKNEVIGIVKNFKKATSVSFLGLSTTYEPICCPKGGSYSKVVSAGLANCGADYKYEKQRVINHPNDTYHTIDTIDVPKCKYDTNPDSNSSLPTLLPDEIVGVEADRPKKCFNCPDPYPPNINKVCGANEEQEREDIMVQITHFKTEPDGGIVTWVCSFVSFGLSAISGGSAIVLMDGLPVISVLGGWVFIGVGLVLGAYALYAGTDPDNKKPYKRVRLHEKYLPNCYMCSTDYNVTVNPYTVTSGPVSSAGLCPSFVATDRPPLAINTTDNSPKYTCTNPDCEVVVAASSDSNVCEWRVIKKCGPIDQECLCNLDISGLESGSYTLQPNIPFTVTEPKVGYPPVSIGSADSGVTDCINNGACGMTCTGMDCCESTESRYMYDLTTENINGVCNQGTLIQNADEDDNTPRIVRPVCLDSNRSIKILKATITQRRRNCREQPSQTSFLSRDAAVAAVNNILNGANSDYQGSAILVYKIVFNPNINKWTQIGSVITINNNIQDNDTPLYYRGKKQYDTQNSTQDFSCDYCKAVYKVTFSGANHPCNDASTTYGGVSINPCNVVTSPPSETPITIATISKIDNPSNQEIRKAINNEDYHYLSLDTAIAEARAYISQTNLPSGSGIILAG